MPQLRRAIHTCYICGNPIKKKAYLSDPCIYGSNGVSLFCSLEHLKIWEKTTEAHFLRLESAANNLKKLCEKLLINMLRCLNK